VTRLVKMRTSMRSKLLILIVQNLLLIFDNFFFYLIKYKITTYCYKHLGLISKSSGPLWYY
jgi:hypothetical protein